MPKCLVLKGKHVVRKWPKQKDQTMGWEQTVLENEHMTSYVHNDQMNEKLSHNQRNTKAKQW